MLDAFSSFRSSAKSRRQRSTVNGDAGSVGRPTGIAMLPPRQREVVFLRYFADLDYRTIARVLDLELGTVSATLSTAHRALRTRLEATRR